MDDGDVACTQFLYSSLCFYVYLFADPSMMVSRFRFFFSEAKYI